MGMKKRIKAILLATVIFSGLSILLHAEEKKDKITFNGAIRFNLRFEDYEGSTYPSNTNFKFDTFRIGAKGTMGDMLVDVQYRFYGDANDSGYQMIHHGWIGYKPTKTSQLELGVTQVPFGNLTYASHNWYFVTPYYVGLEDDYDSGLKYTAKFGNFSLALAYFIQAEPSVGKTENRYSYDITPLSGNSGTREEIGYYDANSNGVKDAGEEVYKENTASDGYSLQEMNQGNIRLAYTIANTEIGVSGQYGQLYNSVLDDWGAAIAGAFHINGNYGPVNLKLQYTYYKYDAKRDDGETAQKVNMSAYSANYFVAAEAMMLTGGIAYKWKTKSLGPISSITFYNDYTYTKKTESTFQDTIQNTLGFAVAAGGVYTYFDYTWGKNQPWIDAGSNWTNGLASGGDNKWHSNFNINIAYYF